MSSLMNSVSAAQKVLEDAVITVMTQEGRCLKPREIGMLTGIFYERGSSGTYQPGMNDAIVNGLLIKLMKEGKVQKCPPYDRTSGYGLVSQLT